MEWLDQEAIIIPMIPTPFGSRRALDVCTGTGLIAERLAQEGWTVCASDISEEMLVQVSPNIEHVLADVCNLPFDNDSFDLVVCRQGLQYVDIETALRSLLRVAKTEVRLGHVTINDGLDFDFWYQYHIKASPGRKQIFRPHEITKLAKEAGFFTVDETVVTEQSDMLYPIKYLADDDFQTLKDSVLKTTKAFKDRNGISVTEDGRFLRTRRWEFHICKVD